MKKFLKKIQDEERKLINALGNNLANIIIFLAIIGVYSLGYWVGKLIF